MVLENRLKKTLRSLGKERDSEVQSRRPWRNRISSGSVHIRWNLNGGGRRRSSSSPPWSAVVEEDSSFRGELLGEKEEESGALRLIGSLRGEDLMEMKGG